MSKLKTFFEAGLAMEEARELKETARTALRTAAAQRCSDELASYDASEVVLNASEKRFAEAMAGFAQEQRNAAHAMLHAHGISCGDDRCPLKTSAATLASEPKSSAN